MGIFGLFKKKDVPAEYNQTIQPLPQQFDAEDAVADERILVNEPVELAVQIAVTQEMVLEEHPVDVAPETIAALSAAVTVYLQAEGSSASKVPCVVRSSSSAWRAAGIQKVINSRQILV